MGWQLRLLKVSKSYKKEQMILLNLKKLNFLSTISNAHNNYYLYFCTKIFTPQFFFIIFNHKYRSELFYTNISFFSDVFAYPFIVSPRSFSLFHILLFSLFQNSATD